jgi:hypothetical protein
VYVYGVLLSHIFSDPKTFLLPQLTDEIRSHFFKSNRRDEDVINIEATERALQHFSQNYLQGRTILGVPLFPLSREVSHLFKIQKKHTV